MKILFVAADRMEFPGILRQCTKMRDAGLRVDWSRQGWLDRIEVLLVANGVGHARAAAAAKAGIADFRPDAVVSTGFCGALSPLLRVADIVVADRVLSSIGLYAAKRPEGPETGHLGAVQSVSYVAQTAAQKRQLGGGGAVAVEMEAAAVAAESFHAALPFFCIRAVTDLAGETMANDFNNALRPDGHFATMKILREAFLDPVNRLPELLRLKLRCILAARALGDFFANNRF